MKLYWNKYYKSKKSPLSPSNFAKYCHRTYLKKNKNLLEVGCGNGRDSLFFLSKKMNVTAVDKSNTIIKKNIDLNEKINFVCLDINNKKIFSLGKFEFIYARFFLHSINEKLQNKLLNNIKKLCVKKKTLLMLEFRTIRDPLYQEGKKISKYERVTDHYRRFIDKDILLSFFLKKNFKILKVIEKSGLAKYKKENPVVCRMIVKSN
tara:strand:- start:650 stop:1267 length:618 start_codon:yes stop_codon:yes gene_type:complete